MAERRVVERRRPGRRQEVGRLVIDQAKGRMGIFVGYCERCDTKHLLDRDELDKLVRYARKDEKSRGGRLFRWIIQSRLL